MDFFQKYTDCAVHICPFEIKIDRRGKRKRRQRPPPRLLLPPLRKSISFLSMTRQDLMVPQPPPLLPHKIPLRKNSVLSNLPLILLLLLQQRLPRILLLLPPPLPRTNSNLMPLVMAGQQANNRLVANLVTFLELANSSCPWVVETLIT